MGANTTSFKPFCRKETYKEALGDLKKRPTKGQKCIEWHPMGANTTSFKPFCRKEPSKETFRDLKKRPTKGKKCPLNPKPFVSLFLRSLKVSFEGH